MFSFKFSKNSHNTHIHHTFIVDNKGQTKKGLKQMKNKKQIGISKASITFYVMAVIFLLIAAFSIYQAYLTVQGYKAQYMLQFTDELNIYLQGCSSSFAFAFIFYAIGVILNKINDLNGSLCLCMDDAIEAKANVDTMDEKSEGNEDFIEDLKNAVEKQESEKLNDVGKETTEDSEKITDIEDEATKETN